MIVYIILEDFGCEGYDGPVKVFDSQEKADTFVREKIKDLYNPVIFVEEVE